MQRFGLGGNRVWRRMQRAVEVPLDEARQRKPHRSKNDDDKQQPAQVFHGCLSISFGNLVRIAKKVEGGFRITQMSKLITMRQAIAEHVPDGASVALGLQLEIGRASCRERV